MIARVAEATLAASSPYVGIVVSASGRISSRAVYVVTGTGAISWSS